MTTDECKNMKNFRMVPNELYQRDENGQPIYNLSALAREVYTLLLSICRADEKYYLYKYRHEDSKGVYVTYSNEYIASDLFTTSRTVIKAMKMLEDAELIQIIKQKKYHSCNKIYVNLPTVMCEETSHISNSDNDNTMCEETSHINVRKNFTHECVKNLHTSKDNIKIIKDNSPSVLDSKNSETATETDRQKVIDLLSKALKLTIKPNHLEIIDTWLNDYKFNFDLVSYCYDTLRKQDTIKLSHFDSRLKAWHDANISTVDKAREYNDRERKQHITDKVRKSGTDNTFKSGAEKGIKRQQPETQKEILSPDQNDISDLLDMFGE